MFLTLRGTRSDKREFEGGFRSGKLQAVPGRPGGGAKRRQKACVLFEQRFPRKKKLASVGRVPGLRVKFARGA